MCLSLKTVLTQIFQVNPEDLFRQAFGGNFDFESIFGSDASGQAKQAQNQTRTRVSFVFSISDVYKTSIHFILDNSMVKRTRIGLHLVMK